MSDFPSREEWAKHRRALYPDKFEDLTIDFEFYPDEIAGITRVLKTEWSRLGKRMRVLIKDKDLDDLERVREEYGELRLFRSQTNGAIRALAGGRLPRGCHETNDFVGAAIAIPQRRRDAAYAVACKQREEQILSTPIDDAAWEAELKWRAKQEELAKGDFIVRVT